jgi:RNA polymerase subunit RPABC4/transcription elongation factor Spt4
MNTGIPLWNPERDNLELLLPPPPQKLTANPCSIRDTGRPYRKDAKNNPVNQSVPPVRISTFQESYNLKFKERGNFSMANKKNLTPCRDCNEGVSNDAEICPHCGAPDPSAHNESWKIYKRQMKNCCCCNRLLSLKAKICPHCGQERK